MKLDDRNNDQVRMMLRYCERLTIALDHFGCDYSTFLLDEPFQDSCSLCLIQIGEAVNRLSGEFKETYSEIPWARIYGMRCHLVHGYDRFDAEIAWDAIMNEIPNLKAFCVGRLGEDCR